MTIKEALFAQKRAEAAEMELENIRQSVRERIDETEAAIKAANVSPCNAQSSLKEPCGAAAKHCRCPFWPLPFCARYARVHVTLSCFVCRVDAVATCRIFGGEKYCYAHQAYCGPPWR